jgi:alpha-1,6-mannosyltransferase
VLIAVGGLAAGALPVSTGVVFARPGLVCVYGGLSLLLLAWWQHGRVDTTTRQVLATLASWVAPLLLAPPMFSRDVYSYLAQGLMLDAGLDVYRHGPAALGGPVAAEVPAVWLHTPSPYGPVFLIVARAVTVVSDTHLLGGVLAMRLVAVLGLALLVMAVPPLARAAGISVGPAFLRTGSGHPSASAR